MTHLMPIGNQANVLVFDPGGYKFGDYTKVGIWLNIIIIIIVAITLPLICSLCRSVPSTSRSKI